MKKWIWISIGGLVLIGGTVATILILKRRKLAKQAAGDLSSLEQAVAQQASEAVSQTSTGSTTQPSTSGAASPQLANAIASVQSNLSIINSNARLKSDMTNIANQLGVRFVDVVIEGMYQKGTIPASVDKATLKAQF